MDWSQIGSDIDGEAEGDDFGYSVEMSADGKTIAVGAPDNDGSGGGFAAGHVRVFKLNEASEQYMQFGPDIDGKQCGDRFGSSLAMSADGNTIAVGAIKINDDGTTSNARSVRMFRVDTTQSSVVKYRQIGSEIIGEAGFPGFGYSLEMSADGNTFVVGSPYEDRNCRPIFGHARVFKFDVTLPQGFTQIGPDLDGAADVDQFGTSVAISADGNTMAVGGVGGGNNAGYVRVYKLDASINQYIQIGYNIDGEAPGDQSGCSLAMSADGSTIVVGARFNDGNGRAAGHVRVYKIDSLGQEYIQIGFNIDGEAADDWFGTSVAMSSDGTTIAVGAIYNNGNGNYAGHVCVYKLDQTVGQYKQIGSDIDGERASDQSGSSLDMSSDGTMIVIGAVSNSGTGGLCQSGHVRVYRYSVLAVPAPCGLLCSIWKFIGRFFEEKRIGRCTVN